MSVFIINQNMAAGGNFYTAIAPELSGDPVVPVQLNSTFTFSGLDGGGLFDFPALGQKPAFQIHRVLLDMGDATSWSLVQRVTDGDGNDLDIIIQDEALAAGNTWEQVGILGNVFFPADELRLICAGGTGARRCQILISDW